MSVRAAGDVVDASAAAAVPAVEATTKTIPRTEHAMAAAVEAQTKSKASDPGKYCLH